MVRCSQCSCPTTERQHRCVVCGHELRMVPARVDGRPSADPRGIPSSEAGVARRLGERVREAARSRITVTELALLVVLGGLTASLSVAVLT